MNDQLQIDAQLQVLHEAEQEYYTTKVKELGSDTFTVEQPESGGKILNLPQFSSWQFCLLRDDAVYFFESRIIDVKTEGDHIHYVIKKPVSVHRQQRRGHVRVPCHHNLIYWYWEDAVIDGLPAPEVVTRSMELWEDRVWLRNYLERLDQANSGNNAFTLDMSGGGLRMVTLEPPDRHDRLLIRLVLDEQKNKDIMLLEAKVVRVVPLNIGGWKRYRVGISFINLTEKVRERIISYLFMLMRKKI